MQKLKFFLLPEKASPAPPVGQILGQYGLNIMDFCKEFNERTKHYKSDIKLYVKVYVSGNKITNIKIKNPPINFFLKKRESKISKVTLKELYHLQCIKLNKKHLTKKELTYFLN